ncbi:SAM-dependent methyltransferase [Pseudomonas sp. FW215-R2]|jgi:ubiquinone/menaquinone biosynthesis C-methylase UbiE|uniref:class I SAM-dependent methyltransferase n=1 Tax=unclassified Pseudomonas TaxID=196821 RepID=UPI000C88A39E|nr:MULTISPECIES: class I SAM-dependent methyltransferase [unclassified Pseudomonas]PMW94303.1 SAM-dependent methyltransferase [Pseudomonas sp. FW215-R2]PMX05294.1 SAM-dependent methyltransferase [Pseudomonas sp. FW215-L1]PMX17366.1 SAM-dependent methyltransferase [Pseudomonas sp. FW215-E1]PNA21498.1 SAM-dependent methyltransferase [Pseudomonas sp. FW215-R4]
MLRLLKKLTASTPAQPAAPVVEDVDTFQLGLRDAMLSGWFNHDTGELYKGFTVGPEDTLVDVGCGDGGNMQFCGMRGARIIVADIDAAKIEAARQRLSETSARSVEYHVTDGNPLPIADNTATRVVSTEVLEHVDDPAQFLAELVRIGQPGALYLLSVPHPSSEDVQKGIAIPEYFEKPNHIRIISEEQFKAMVSEAGLEIVSHSQYGFYRSLWMLLFWEANVDLGSPDHPLLNQWTKTWEAVLNSPRGTQIKHALDSVMAKSQVIIARKP